MELNGKQTPVANRGLFGQMAIPEGNRTCGPRDPWTAK